MQRQHPLLQANETSFEAICRFASTGDEKGLWKLLHTGVLINTQCGVRYPVGELAERGNHQAVSLLIDKFNAFPYVAIYVYAKKGDVARVRSMIKTETDIVHAIGGYAEGNFTQEAEALMQPDNLTHQCAAITSYAKGGHDQKVFQLVNQTNPAHLNAAIYGFAIRGNHAEVQRLLELGASPQIRNKGYVAGNHIAQLNFAITNPEQSRDVGEVVSYFARAGEAGMVISITENAPDNAKFVLRLHASCGFAAGGHVKQANWLNITENTVLEAGLSYTDLIANHYLDGRQLTNLDDLQRLLTFTNDVRLRESIINRLKLCLTAELELNQAYVVYSPFFSLTDLIEKEAKLLAKAEKLNACMKKYRCDYGQALAVLSANQNRLSWFLQGHQITEKPDGVPPLVYQRISSYVIGQYCGDQDVRTITDLAKKMYRRSYQFTQFRQKLSDDRSRTPDESETKNLIRMA